MKFLHPSVGVSGCQVGWSRRSPGWPCATHGRCGEFGLGVWGPGSRLGGERQLVSLVVMYKCIELYWCILYIVHISRFVLLILFILFSSWLWVWWGSDESLWGSVTFGFGGSRGLRLTGISSQEEDDCGDHCAGPEISEISKLVESPSDLLIVEFLKEIPNNQFFYGICG